MGATVPDYRIENQAQSNVNIEEGVDDNGNNEENTYTVNHEYHDTASFL